MTDDQVRASLVDRVVLGLTMWGEGRGDWRQGNSSVEERIAIGCSVRNRLPRFKEFRAAAPTYRAICLAPQQYSCWSPTGGQSNYDALMVMATGIAEGSASPMKDPLLAESFFLADGIMSGVILDRTAGATQYYAPAAMQPPGRRPVWARNRVTLTIGSQEFLST